MKKCIVWFCIALGLVAADVVRADECGLAAAEFAKYHRLITGREPDAAALRLEVDPSVSASGNDAYTIVSDEKGAKITGSNGRSVLYGVYDLLERRGGCGWFWDGDRVPRKAEIDLSGLDVREESKFTYRGLRYFAHRGLMRFQAEHWGPEEWKREIDWCLKKRLNLFMLRIGQDDVFQKAFPDAAKYPDPSKPLPGALSGYDNRTLFWPLEYRGRLRKEVMDYAFAHGMMAPEDFGTMTHWYSRTPQDFLETMKPDFFPQKGGAYSEPSGLIFDIRQEKYRDWYWKLTETSIREYGRPDLLHTIGVAERRVSDDPKVNRQTKIDFTKMIMENAHRHYPDSKILLAGWDFYATWRKEDVPVFLKELDPSHTIVWDYEADAYAKTNFTEWDVIGKFPYTFGVFMAYEAGLDMRTDYDRIVARQKLIENDPMCKGYILWPESSHVDSIGLEWFAKNSWRADRMPVSPVIADYCARRYPDEATAMRELWTKTLPVSTNMQHVWRWNAFLPVLRDMGEGLITPEKRENWPAPKDEALFADLPNVVAALKALDWEKDEMLRRDMMDIARVWADRLAIEAENRMVDAYFRWLDGNDSAAEDVCRNGALALARLNALAELLALHEDFSICDTYDRVNAIHPIAYKDFMSVLVDNAANSYCSSHQAELARFCYIPAFEHYLDILKKRILANDRTPPERKCLEAYRTRAMKLGFDELRLKVPRTRESFNRALDRIIAASTPSARELVGRGRPDLTDKDGAHWWKDRHEAKLKAVAEGPKEYDLALIGDSITHFWESHPSNGWEMVTNTWKTLNLGFGGDRVQNVIWRLEHGELDNCRAKTVTIMIGTNNHAWKLEASEPEATAAAVRKIIDLVRERQPEARIVLFGIFPRGTSAKDARLVEAQRRNVAANVLLNQVAHEAAVEWVDLTDRYLDPATGFCRPELFRDGTHPSRAGYEIWFEALKQVMNPPPMTPPPALMTSAGWDARRAEMLKTLTEEEYGVRPVERPANLRFTPIGADSEALGGRAIRRRVRISYGGPGGEGHFDVLAFLPKGGTKSPAFVQILLGQTARRIGFDPETFEGCSRCPLAKIIGRGYALALFINWELAMDDPATCFQTGVFRCWPPKDGVRGPKDWGAISAWAWGASRVMDWIETVPELDAKRVAVIGHSRGGKTALWAGATDRRFAYAISNDSGCSGARISHMDLPGAETVARITSRFPHWFCTDYRQWAGRQRELPFDQHWLLALIAPRPLAVGSATRDVWAGPKGEFESARLASPAWELFGRKGLVADAFPSPEMPLSDGTVSYHLRTGKHDLTEADWDVYLDFWEKR